MLKVKKSSYYYWLSHRELTAERLNLHCQVKSICAEVDQTFGSRRISDTLKDKGFNIGRQKARSLMQEADIVPVYPKNRYVCLKCGAGASRIAENHLNREFEVARPNQKWVVDILRTYGQQRA